MSAVNDENSRDENQPRDSHAKPSHYLWSSIHKKRRRSDEVQQPRQREVLNVTAPKRLLQFAVSDAVATSRPSNPTAEPSFKRLRSMVSTSTDSPAEQPHRACRASMSVAIKAMAEAVKDVTKVRPSHNAFDRLGNATNDPNIISHSEYGGFAEDLDGDSNAEVENLHSYHRPNDIIRLQEGSMSTFHDDVMDTDLECDKEGYDVVGLRGGGSMNIFSLVSEEISPQSIKYRSANHVDGTSYRPHKNLGQFVVMHNVRNPSFLNKIVRKPHTHYQEEIEAAEMDDRENMRGADTVPTKPVVRLMKDNNNLMVAFNGKVKTDATLHESEKTQTPSEPVVCDTN